MTVLLVTLLANLAAPSLSRGATSVDTMQLARADGTAFEEQRPRRPRINPEQGSHAVIAWRDIAF